MNKQKNTKLRTGAGSLLAAALAGISAVATAAQPAVQPPAAQDAFWWRPGSGETMPAQMAIRNANGALGIVNADGAVNTRGHPFFEPIGANGRACVTCHQPSDGFSLSLKTVTERWAESGGKDPLFAMVDGANCPNLPPADPASHSMLLEHGLIRVAMPWPYKKQFDAFAAREPEFTIEVVKDPAGCNLDAEYGLKSANPTISVYRRVRPTTNLRYVVDPSYDLSGRFNNKTGVPLPVDPATGKHTGLPIMSDGRADTLEVQMQDAIRNHMQGMNGELTDEVIAQIKDYESQVYSAQISHNVGGSLVETGAPPALGPYALASGRSIINGNNWRSPTFMTFEAWEKDKPANDREAFRASVARGNQIFLERPIWISEVTGFNSIGMGNPYKRTCVICHSVHMTGNDFAPGVMDLGVNNEPWANAGEVLENSHLPLFKLTCKPEARPHPFAGREVYTHDPGRALLTGLCHDIGSLVMQPMRGMSARAPYFSNGSAKDIAAVVDYYNARFTMELTDQEREDLINFLSVL
ncbi:MAG: hypothetical protein H6978_10665 [Gammaproteobacteria bacterium]|nr:hypothetical protein [Gammaproteobacteria bacterium]